MKIYVASSWRNQYQPEVVKMLRRQGHQVYDFKDPMQGAGFSWASIAPNWQQWTSEQYIEALDHPLAVKGFRSDFNAMKISDICLMVLPCGRSASVEAGWMKGAGKKVYVYIPIPQEPELMYNLFDGVISDPLDLESTFKNMLP